MEFLVLEIGATLAALLAYLATVIWHDVSHALQSYRRRRLRAKAPTSRRERVVGVTGFEPATSTSQT